MRQRIADLAYGLLLPTFVIVMVIVIFPMVWNVVLAFRPIRLRDLPDLRLFSLDEFTLDNFNRVINSRGFVDTLVRTFVYTISGTVLAILLGLIAALIVKDRFPGRNLVRGFLLFPYIAPIISVVLIWKLLFNAQFGLVNEVVDALGGRRVDFLSTPATAFTMVILFQAWRYFPFAFLFILARIQAIPDDLYEAAKVDGAAPSQRLLHITLPQLRAVFGTLFLLRFIWTFNKFDDVFLLTGGAANTQLITIEIYDQLFSARNVGTAAAVALILAAVLFVIVGIYFRWFMVEEH
ncbi:MAG: sugar ABC transporter permease [Anaerolineae bacterium]|nr:sugar ABC transporter permease [Anaerolineae bacterium]